MSPINLGQLPSNQPAPTGQCQVKRGAVGGETTWNNTVAAQPLQDGAGGQMYIQVTPPRAGWWLIHAAMIWRTPDAVWTYWHWGVVLSPTDAFGYGDDRNHVCQHSALVWNESIINTAFRLNASTTYTAYMWWPNATLGWNQTYYTGPEYHYILGEFIEDGSL